MTNYYAVHHDWMKGCSSPVPVGIWDESGQSYYPTANAHFEARGHRGSERPDGRSWANHLLRLTEIFSPDDANWGVVASSGSMVEMMEALWRGFAASTSPGEPLPFLAPDKGGSDSAKSLSAAEAASRFVLAQSWWIASELVRRHPELVVHEMHPGGGMYDVLALFNPRDGEFTGQMRVMLNRAGSIQIHHPVDSGRADIVVGSWANVLTTDDAHHYIKAIESGARLGHPEKTPESTHRSLAFRFISSVLTASVNDRHRWDARNEFIDSPGDGWGDEPELNGYLAKFSNARPDLPETPRIGLWHEPESHYWAILRDESPVAIVSLEGRIYLHDRRIDLLPTYNTNGRSMLRLIADALGDLLP